ncbi:Poly(A) polymerase I [Candidatus Kinetoplastibacterium sorsogonicusi]|uniref:Poly(A) polymerase I n=1 Tax=Candidatus Kinetoplastidibacterium kentomonadis TaxID=1576550 RepID=A0A3Q8EUJ6_9PROT|nr:polynucleotide adenylyltransferase PcnB [Candidatus Kinetoplastibacterium sorsogonicusi]AWD32648.1 Poly(A) polymerase I [Candidatus Kinetoplastibacterium sorsogonicusi]
MSSIITKFFNKIYNFCNNKKEKIIYSKNHKINISLISKNAIKICKKLRDCGYEAYIVGGAIRDILVNIKPKDFDIATNATPDEVKCIFRKSRIIGKRFKIVHVIMNQELVEVSTFRTLPSSKQILDKFGRIIRDNNFGSQKEDAERRDFTINALYYDPIKEDIIDFHNGFKDLKNKNIVIIGDAEKRYREDPIRMLRAFRFASKLNAKISDNTLKPIRNLGFLLKNIPCSRLLDEIIKIFSSGQAVKNLDFLINFGLYQQIFLYVDKKNYKEFLNIVLSYTDKRVLIGKSINPSFLLASILWPLVYDLWQIIQKKEKYIPALVIATKQILEKQNKKMNLQQKFCSEIREIFFMQPRFEKINKKNISKMIKQNKFRAACNFFLLQSIFMKKNLQLANWWMLLANSNELEKEKMIQEIFNNKNLLITNNCHKNALS